MKPEELVELIEKAFEQKGKPDVAEQQSRYMKYHFPYYGLKAPQWKEILKHLFSEYGTYTGDDLFIFVRGCFVCEYREMHYAGLQMLEKRTRKLPVEGIHFLEECALSNSWWDTVDWVNKLVGIHFKRFPELQQPTATEWIASENIWLQRLAIIHQLTYRAQTDWELLQNMIARRVNSSEFFVQKAIGWALRQYSKTEPSLVLDYIERHPELPALSQREGLKWVKQNGYLT